MSRIRITGGQWRSRLLPVAKVPGLRPTPDRVRETLFNWLGQDLTGWRCLDLFAGSGAIGLEAASRGAQAVTLVDSSPRVCAVLEQQIAALGATQVELLRRDALKFAATVTKNYDLVVLDPPYDQGWMARLAPFMERLVAPEGCLYVEAESPVTAMGPFRAEREGRAGQVCYQLMRRAHT